MADAPALIERAVNELIDWHVDQEFRQWQAVTSKLVERQRQHASRMLGAPEVGSFHTDRTRLIDSVGRQAQRVVATYDKRLEGETIADQARVAVAASAGREGNGRDRDRQQLPCESHGFASVGVREVRSNDRAPHDAPTF